MRLSMRLWMHLGLSLHLLAASVASGSPDLPALAPEGELRVLFLAVDGTSPIPRTLRHFENQQVLNQPWSQVAELHHFLFERDSSLAKLIEEMSFGRVTLGGDSLLLFLPFGAQDLTWSQWTAQADQAALAQGFDPESYDRILYVLPYLPAQAPATGLALGKRGWCAFLSRVETDCLFHEFAHTLGMRHAGERQPDGTSNGLGDDSDGLMGSGFNAHVNAVNKYVAGWLGGKRLAVFDRTGAEYFRIAPQSESDDTLQVVKVVNNGAHPEAGVVDTFVSFRRAEGADAQLLSSLADHNGDLVAGSVLIHQWPRVFPTDTLYVRALKAGHFHEENGVRVSVLGIGKRGATIRVTRAPYEPLAPLLSLSSSAQVAGPGHFVFYTLSVTNRNDPQLVDFDSNYEIALPYFGPGWTVGWTSGGDKTVPPGGTRDFEFLVFPPVTAAPGLYPIEVKLSDSDGDFGPVYSRVTGVLEIAP